MALPKPRQGMQVEPSMAAFDPGCAALVFYSYLREALQHWLPLLTFTDIALLCIYLHLPAPVLPAMLSGETIRWHSLEH